MKKQHLLTSAILAFATSQATPAFAENMLVERVRYCVSRGIENVCKDSQLNPKFQFWGPTQRQEQLETYISIINEPPRHKVKRVVFVSAGQQINNGYPNALTGQPDKFKKNCKNRTQSCSLPIHPMSLVGRLRASEGDQFSDDETLYISVLDAKFGYFRSHSQKQTLENTYWNFLTSKFDPANVELMVLAGQSRGGCLAFRLGSRMRKTTAYKNIPLIVQGYDPVCTTLENPAGGLELPPGKVRISPTATLPFTKINNPLNSGFGSYIVDMDKVFPKGSRNKLKVLDIHAGGKVGHQNTIRSFTWYNQDTDIGWWKQKWVNYEHNDMGNYLTSASATAHARPEIGDVGYGHIFNYSAYTLPDLLREEEANRTPKPTNFRAKQRFPVDVNGDRKSDIILAYQDPKKGLTLHTKISNGDGTFADAKQVLGDGYSAVRDLPLLSGYFNEDNKTDILSLYQHRQTGLALRTKMSNGDGTYTSKQHITGDGRDVHKFPVFVGDVDGDGLSDVILRYQHKTEGLHIVTNFSKGDGSFRRHDFKAGDGNLGKTLRTHVGDINGDKKTDLIYLYQRASDKSMEIRTRTSNGDGTFEFNKTLPLHWTPMTNVQSFVADVNRDKKSEVIVLERGRSSKELQAHTFFFKPDGSYDRVIEKFTDGLEVDDMETVIADVTGDSRSDIVMRVRDKKRGLIVRVKKSQGNGRFTPYEYIAGDGGQVDNLRILTGNYDAGTYTDLALRYRASPTDGLFIRTKLAGSQGSFRKENFQAGDGNGVDKMDALSGPIRWDGGGTFPRPPSTGPIKVIANKPAVLLDRNVTSGGALETIKPGRELIKAPERLTPRDQLKQPSGKVTTDGKVLVEPLKKPRSP